MLGAPPNSPSATPLPRSPECEAAGNSTSSRVNGLTTRRWPCVSYRARSRPEPSTFAISSTDSFVGATRGYLTSRGKCFGIGSKRSGHPSDFTKSGTVTRNSSRRWRAGNGSLMRLAPVPMVFAHDLDLAACASACSLTTHPVTECREACATYGRLIAGALRGWERRNLAEGPATSGRGLQ